MDVSTRSIPSWARQAAFAGARLIAQELHALDINVDCTPVLDVPEKGAHEIIGDRAFASDPEVVIALGRAVMEGCLAGGVLPVIKHVPGHGRAKADSHLSLPRIDAAEADLDAIDFRPFRALRDAPLAMTAHVLLPPPPFARASASLTAVSSALGPIEHLDACRHRARHSLPRSLHRRRRRLGRRRSPPPLPLRRQRPHLDRSPSSRHRRPRPRHRPHPHRRPAAPHRRRRRRLHLDHHRRRRHLAVAPALRNTFHLKVLLRSSRLSGTFSDAEPVAFRTCPNLH